MLAVRNFLLSIFGGTELMWDVALGVFMAGFILWLIQILVSAVLESL